MFEAEHIKEAYIKPIRSVVAIDDEFPTLDELLEGGSGADVSLPAAQELKALTEYCRSQEWLVDVHDGSKINVRQGVGLAANLHQTDLLVLDYNLEGTRSDGTKCISILQELCRNPHFNLVVVYTGDTPADVFRNIAECLVSPTELELSNEKSAAIEEFWNSLKGGPHDPAPFENAVDQLSFLKIRRQTNRPTGDLIRGQTAALSSFARTIGPLIPTYLNGEGSEGERFTVDDICVWLMQIYEQREDVKLDVEGIDVIRWDFHADNNANWIRTGNLFLTVLPKSDVKGDQIVDSLVDALLKWGPTPHRLILSKLRAVLENKGGAIEDSALQDKFVQAGLLYQVLGVEGEQRRGHLFSLMERHWNEVLKSLTSEVFPFAESMVAHEANRVAGDVRRSILGHYGNVPGGIAPRDLEKLPLHLNWHVSMEPISGFHLQTGHIFDYDGERWVCLSPKCDLVPDQGHDQRWRKRLEGRNLPFKVVKLHQYSANELDFVLERATSGNFIFLKEAGEITAYGFVPMRASESENNPHWELMVATNQGRISEGKFCLRSVKWDDGVNLTDVQEVMLVGQLRYEYALNLQQRLGGNQTRVGLDFVSKLVD